MDEIDFCLLDGKQYTKIYKFNYILIVIILISSYIICMFEYQTYYLFRGRMIDNQLEIKVPVEDIEYFKNNHYLLIANQKYRYKITDISNLYIDDNYHNYLYLYLTIPGLSNVDNYIYEAKIPKEKKRMAKYLKDYL